VRVGFYFLLGSFFCVHVRDKKRSDFVLGVKNTSFCVARLHVVRAKSRLITTIFENIDVTKRLLLVNLI